MRKVLVIPLLTCYIVMTGCAVFLIGAGVGAGTFSYVRGELKRTYEAEYNQCIEAGKETLEALKMPLEESLADGLKTILNARRADGTLVTLKIVVLAPNRTEVGIRCGVIGIWDKKAARLIHELIAKRLQP